MRRFFKSPHTPEITITRQIPLIPFDEGGWGDLQPAIFNLLGRKKKPIYTLDKIRDYSYLIEETKAGISFYTLRTA